MKIFIVPHNQIEAADTAPPVEVDVWQKTPHLYSVCCHVICEAPSTTYMAIKILLEGKTGLYHYHSSIEKKFFLAARLHDEAALEQFYLLLFNLKHEFKFEAEDAEIIQTVLVPFMVKQLISNVLQKNVTTGKYQDWLYFESIGDNFARIAQLEFIEYFITFRERISNQEVNILATCLRETNAFLSYAEMAESNSKYKHQMKFLFHAAHGLWGILCDIDNLQPNNELRTTIKRLQQTICRLGFSLPNSDDDEIAVITSRVVENVIHGEINPAPPQQDLPQRTPEENILYLLNTATQQQRELTAYRRAMALVKVDEKMVKTRAAKVIQRRVRKFLPRVR